MHYMKHFCMFMQMLNENRTRYVRNVQAIRHGLNAPAARCQCMLLGRAFDP